VLSSAALQADACELFCDEIWAVYRNLRKKLAKVEAAKDKQAKGEELTPEQAESIAGEAALREEMRSLGANDV
jgi:hypothetical protein